MLFIFMDIIFVSVCINIILHFCCVPVVPTSYYTSE